MAAPLPDKNIWWTEGTQVRENVIAGSGLADMLLVGPWGPRQCFEDNRHQTTWPIGLETFHGCDGVRLPLQADTAGLAMLLGASADAANDWPPGSDYRTYPAPPAQPQMPGAVDTPATPAVDVFVRPDIDSIPVPEAPAGLEIRASEVTVSGVPISEPTFWTLVFSVYAYFLPVILYAAWVAIAIWDLVRRDDTSRAMVIGWVAVILLVPFLGPIAYYIFGRSRIPAWLRGTVVGGGIGAYLMILAVAAVLGGVV